MHRVRFDYYRSHADRDSRGYFGYLEGRGSMIVRIVTAIMTPIVFAFMMVFLPIYFFFLLFFTIAGEVFTKAEQIFNSNSKS